MIDWRRFVINTEGDTRLSGRTYTRRAFIASAAAATIAGLGSLALTGRSGVALADGQVASDGSTQSAAPLEGQEAPASGAQGAVAGDMPVFNIPTSLPAWVDVQAAQTLLSQASDPDVASILCDAQALGELDQDLAEKLLELAADDPAARSFVAGFRTSYPGTKAGGLTEDDLPADGSIPHLMQWDKRWGYESYGDSIIGLAGCGPTCLSMVYVYFTHDLNGTPREIASYCEKNGYYTENGTSWSLWTEGLPALGLSGKELPLVENSMKTALDQGKLIVCSMRPGDFTTSGHYILLYDYDDTGFCVKDPNRVSNSSRTWDYDTLSPQIKNLWTISPTGF